MSYPYSLPSLPYAFDALEPHIDAQTMQIHHGKHHQAYVNNLNAALEKAPEWQKKGLGEILASLASTILLKPTTLPARIFLASAKIGSAASAI